MGDQGIRGHREHVRVVGDDVADVRRGTADALRTTRGGALVRPDGHVDRGDRLPYDPIVAEDDVAMPVHAERRGGGLVPDEGRERAAAATVVLVLGRRLNLLPDGQLGGRAFGRVVDAERHAGVPGHGPEVHHGELRERIGSECPAQDLGRAHARLIEEAVDHPAVQRQDAGRILAQEVLADADLAEVLRVVGDRAPVARPIDARVAQRLRGLESERIGQLDAALPLGEAIRAAWVVPGRVLHEADGRVEREPCVQVGGPEERLAVRVVVVAPLADLRDLERLSRRRLATLRARVDGRESDVACRIARHHARRIRGIDHRRDDG